MYVSRLERRWGMSKQAVAGLVADVPETPEKIVLRQFG
jgi:hypothetical protein